MSYQEFLTERDRIDFLIQKGYSIRAVQENLDGAFVQFGRQNDGESETETLHVRTADGRKYFSAFLIRQGTAG
ncbi:hypothetical protein [Bacillus sp. OTU530]|jgi:hypothetical protein|uniref:hypothetical protein n=1 Tax=Bacillus sp. OTU530 TaxID=3043862 RepID=UPI00313AA3DB